MWRISTQPWWLAAPRAATIRFPAARTQLRHHSTTAGAPSSTRSPTEVSDDSLLSLFTKQSLDEVDYTPQQEKPLSDGTVFSVDSAEQEERLREKIHTIAPPKGKNAPPAILLESDRSRYAQLIYHEHYHVQSGAFVASGKAVDDQGWQSAGMEIQWIEEWALDLAVNETIEALVAAGNSFEVAQAHVAGSVWACSSFRSYKELMEIAGEEEQEELRASAPPQPTEEELDCFRDVYTRALAIIRKAVLERADLRKPLSYILGEQPFYGTTIRCVPPLLIPRPETETWVHWLDSLYIKKALRKGAELRVLDMCCGTGCVGIALAKSIRTCSVTAVDILDEAVATSLANAAENGIPCAPSPLGGAVDGKGSAPSRPPRYRCLQGDMFKALGPKTPSTPTYDIIVSNPPYIYEQEYEELDPSVRRWESKTALVGDPAREKAQWTYFRDLCHDGHAWASDPQERYDRTGIEGSAPSIVIEVGSQAEMVAGMLEFSGLWADVQLHLDLKGKPRWVTAVWQPAQPPRLPSKKGGGMLSSYLSSLWNR